MSTADETTGHDPFRVLGLTSQASEEDIRARYLTLVKQHPPEQDAQRFREIHAAYEAAKDPLVLARKLLEPPSDDLPSWSEIIEQQKAQPPRMSVKLLLSLGNQDSSTDTSSASSHDS
jgi:curved DNA-binding protein CbpA